MGRAAFRLANNSSFIFRLLKLWLEELWIQHLETSLLVKNLSLVQPLLRHSDTRRVGCKHDTMHSLEMCSFLI